MNATNMSMQNHLLQLPDELFLMITDYLTRNEMRGLGLTCRRLVPFYQGRLYRTITLYIQISIYKKGSRLNLQARNLHEILSRSCSLASHIREATAWFAERWPRHCFGNPVTVDVSRYLNWKSVKMAKETLQHMAPTLKVLNFRPLRVYNRPRVIGENWFIREIGSLRNIRAVELHEIEGLDVDCINLAFSNLSWLKRLNLYGNWNNLGAPSDREKTFSIPNLKEITVSGNKTNRVLQTILHKCPNITKLSWNLEYEKNEGFDAFEREFHGISSFLGPHKDTLVELEITVPRYSPCVMDLRLQHMQLSELLALELLTLYNWSVKPVDKAQNLYEAFFKGSLNKLQL